MSWNLTVILLSTLLLLFFIWKENRRVNRSRFTARIVASVFAASSLAFISLPLSINRKRTTKDSGSVVLLTKGFSSDSVKALLDRERISGIFTLDKALTAFKAFYISNADTLTSSNDVLHVFGHGLTKHQLASIGDKPVVYHPNPLNADQVTNAHWTQNISSGEPLIVQGTFMNTKGDSVKLVLSGFNTSFDSAMISAKHENYFQLSASPKHIGRAVYSLAVLFGGDTIEVEPIPVDVRTAEPLSILVLAASPDFENKFLKNWLVESQYKLAVRTTISRNKFDRQFANIPQVSLDVVTPALLEKFDVLIADASQLSALSSASLNVLRNAVSERGIGLIVKADSVRRSSAFYAGSFSLLQTRDSIQHLVAIRLSENESLLPALKIEQPVFIRPNPETKSLVSDQQGRSLAGAKLYGAGKVILSTVPNTYAWRLAGSNDAYNSYWSYLIRSAAKKKVFDKSWTISPPLPRRNEELQLELQSYAEGIPEVYAGAERLSLKQDVWLPYQWSAKYWPARSGWQPLLANDSSTFMYVYEQKDWEGIKTMEKSSATRDYARLHPLPTFSSATIETVEHNPVPKIFFLVLFVLCAGFLWFEKKLTGDGS